eukprot:Clim_evm38s172 gene=Clim_evmTU38s172
MTSIIGAESPPMPEDVERNHLRRSARANKDEHVPLLADMRRHSDVLRTSTTSLGPEFEHTLHDRGSKWDLFKKEANIVPKLAFPSTTSYTLSQLLALEEVIFIGRIGTLELAASALANTWLNLVWTTLYGSASCVNAFAGQAVGAGDMKEARVWFIRGQVITAVLMTPALIISIWAPDLFALLGVGEEGAGGTPGDSEEVIRLMRQFIIYSLPGLAVVNPVYGFQLFHNVHNIMWPANAMYLIGNVLNVLMLHFFIEWFGFIGAPIATSSVRVVLLLMFIAYDKYASQESVGYVSPWFTYKELFENHAAQIKHLFAWDYLKEYLELALPGLVMTAAEVTLFESVTILAARLGVVSVDAHAILLQLISTYYMIPLGLSGAVAIRVSNLIGAGAPRSARMAAFIGLGITFLCCLTTGILTLILREPIMKLFNSNPDVVRIGMLVAIPASCYMVFDGNQSICNGVWRAVGQQKQVAIVNFGALLAGGLGSGCVLVYVLGFGVEGFWWGMFVGLFLSNVAYLYMAQRGYLDLDELSKAAVERYGSNDGEGSGSDSLLNQVRDSIEYHSAAAGLPPIPAHRDESLSNHQDPDSENSSLIQRYTRD